jgi:hypothetical protein
MGMSPCGTRVMVAGDYLDLCADVTAERSEVLRLTDD